MNIRESSRRGLARLITVVVFLSFVFLYSLFKNVILEWVFPMATITEILNKKQNTKIDECTIFLNAKTKDRNTVQIMYLINKICIDKYGLTKIRGSADGSKDYFIFNTKNTSDNDFLMKRKPIIEFLYYDNENKLIYKTIVSPEEYKK